jgi:Sigma-70, region 4
MRRPSGSLRRRGRRNRVQLPASLSELTDRDREVVRARFGFDGEAERLADVRARLGVSAERVRQIEERALAKLRRATSPIHLDRLGFNRLVKRLLEEKEDPESLEFLGRRAIR